MEMYVQTPLISETVNFSGRAENFQRFYCRSKVPVTNDSLSKFTISSEITRFPNEYRKIPTLTLVKLTQSEKSCKIE